MTIKAVLLDVDGVLFDSDEANAQSYADALRVHGFEVPSRKEILSHMGEDGNVWMANLLPKDKRGDEELIKKLRKHTLEKYHGEHFPKLCKVAPDMVQTLENLRKKYKLAIITNNHRETWENHKKLLDWKDLFDLEICIDDVKNGKPSPEPIEKALEKLGLSKEEALFVGDTKFDLEAAEGAGVKCVLITFERNEDLKADYRIKNLGELPELLEKL